MNKHVPISSGVNHNPTDGIHFHRTELSPIISLYGRMVAAGEWRDYGISSALRPSQPAGGSAGSSRLRYRQEPGGLVGAGCRGGGHRCCVKPEFCLVYTDHALHTSIFCVRVAYHVGPRLCQAVLSVECLCVEACPHVELWQGLLT